MKEYIVHYVLLAIAILCVLAQCYGFIATLYNLLLITIGGV